MTLSVLCIARVLTDRTIAFEQARACSGSLHCVVAVGHWCLLERFAARSCNHRFLLYPYNDGRAVQLAVAPDKTPNAAPGGRAASLVPRRTASRRLQMLNVNTSCIAASAAPLSRGAPECVLQVNV
jgi:hypothetical protein